WSPFFLETTPRRTRTRHWPAPALPPVAPVLQQTQAARGPERPPGVATGPAPLGARQRATRRSDAADRWCEALWTSRGGHGERSPTHGHARTSAAAPASQDDASLKGRTGRRAVATGPRSTPPLQRLQPPPRLEPPPRCRRIL